MNHLLLAKVNKITSEIFLLRKVMSAPNILQVETPVNIFVQCLDCTDGATIMVDIVVLSYPTKSRRLTSTVVTLGQENDFQAFGVIRVISDGTMFSLVAAIIYLSIN